MRYCERCGQVLEQNSNFCGNCGYQNIRKENYSSNNLVSEFQYLFKNPMQFFRNSLNIKFDVTAIFIGIILFLTVIDALIEAAGIGISFKWCVSSVLRVIARVGFMSLFIWVFNTVLCKNKIDYLKVLNIFVYTRFISTVLYVWIDVANLIIPSSITSGLTSAVSTLFSLISYKIYTEISNSKEENTLLVYCISTALTMIILNVLV